MKALWIGLAFSLVACDGAIDDIRPDAGLAVKTGAQVVATCVNHCNYKYAAECSLFNDEVNRLECYESCHAMSLELACEDEYLALYSCRSNIAWPYYVCAPSGWPTPRLPSTCSVHAYALTLCQILN